MFEHLGPVPEVNLKRKKANYKFYLSLLVFSVFLFTFALSTSKGPSSYAGAPEELSAKVFVDSSDKKVVSDSKNFPVFDFVVDINTANTSLYKLNILVEGVYDLSLIEDLKLFNDNVQLGQIDNIDLDGKIHFDLSEYKLKAGQNTFSLFFNDGVSLENKPVLKFSIANDDIYLMKDGHVFKPQANFPLSSGLVSVLDRGFIQAQNNYLANDLVVRANVPQKISSFGLRSIGEKSDLEKIVLSYNSSQEDYPDLDFILSIGNNIVSQTKSEGDKIVFNINNNIVLQDLDTLDLNLHTLGLPEGVYDFSVEEVEAQGMWSGETILLDNNIDINTVESKPYFIQFKLGDLDKKLSTGWNKIYSTKLQAKGGKNLYINKLTYQLNSQNVDIDSVEVYVNDEPYIADVVLRDDKLIIKTDASKPLEIGNEESEILILAKLSNVNNKAKVEVVLLPDKEASDSEGLEGNIIWSDGDNFYNSYKLPYLPLEPSILSN